MGVLKALPAYVIPIVFLIVLFFGYYREIKVYDVFVEGAKQGIPVIIKILPSLVGLLVAIGIFKSSGALELLVYILGPVADFLHIPSYVVPLAILRPVSGSASLALVSDILKTHGSDSFIGRVASTMMGSTETIFYTLTVYFGAVGIKNIRHTLTAALIADAVSVIASVYICRVLFC